MNKRFFNQQNLTRRLRLLPVLFAMLLLPLGAWAQTTYKGGDYTSTNGSWGDWTVTGTNVTFSSGSTGTLNCNVPANSTSTIQLSLTQTQNTSEKLCKLTFSPSNSKLSLVSAKIVSSDGTTEYTEFTTQVQSNGSFRYFNATTPIEWGEGKKLVLTCQYVNETNTVATPSISGATVTTGTPYDLVVKGIIVTTANKDCVTGGTTNWNGQTEVSMVSFDPTGNKLNLCKADLSGPIQLGSSMNSLIIDINGDCDITTTDAEAISSESAASITFTTSSTGSLRLKRNDGTGLVGSSITLSYNAGLSAAIVAPTSASTLADATEAIIKNLYSITVAGVQVTETNAGNVLEDAGTPTVIFTPADYTVSPATSAILTLNSATISNDDNGIEYSGTENLTIKLKGSNTVSCSGEGIAIKYSGTLETPPTLTIAKGDTNPCSLVLEADSDGDTTEGFTVSYDGFYTYNDDTEEVRIKTFTTLGGGSGTSTDPIIIKTAEDLRDFAKLVNRSTINDEYIKLTKDGELDCNGLTRFEPIGTGDMPFIGKFDGNNCTIKNLTYSTEETGDYVGLFGIVGNEDVSDTKIEKLTLSNCNFNGGGYVGGIVGKMVNGTIENCVLSSCNVIGGNAFNLYVGGIAGQVDNGTINKCTFKSGLVDGSTAYSGAPSTAYAGGIVGYISSTNSVTVSSCTVSSTNVKSVTSGEDGAYDIYVGGLVGRSLNTVAISDNKITNTDNTKKISCQNINGTFTTYHCGAIIGEKGDETTLTNNTYEYDVTTDIAGTTKSGYTQRGIGGTTYNTTTQQYEPNPDITANNGAVMYTKTLTVGVSNECESYEPLTDYENGVLAFAPGQTIDIYLYPADGVTISAASLVYTPAGGTEQTVPLENESETAGEYNYVFEMPDANATLNATLVQAYDLRIAGTRVTEANAGNVLGDGTVSYDAENHKLTLNGVNIELEEEEAVIDYSGTNDLTICLKGTNTLQGYDSEAICGDGNTKLFFTREGTQPCSLQLTTTTENSNAPTVISGFSAIQGVYGIGDASISNALTLGSDAQVSYSSTNGLYTGEASNPTSVSSVSIIDFYSLTIGDVRVTSENAADILGDGDETKTATFTPSTTPATLTLNGFEDDCNITSGLDNLNVVLTGSNSVGNIVYGGAATTRSISFSGTGSLTFDATSVPYGFTDVTYGDNLAMKVTSAGAHIITPLEAPVFWPTFNDKEQRVVELRNYFADATVTYSLTYANTSLASQNKTDETYTEAFVLKGPATITTKATIGSKVSAVATAYYFGAETNPMKFTYGDSFTAPTLVPNVEGVSILADSYESSVSLDGVATLNNEHTSFTLNGVGKGLAYARVGYPEQINYTVLNATDSLGFCIEVVPPEPAIAFDNGKTYLDTDNIVISLDETYATYASNNNVTNTIYYSWAANPTSGEVYSEGAVTAQTGTLTAWVVATVSDVNYESAKATQEFTAKTDISGYTVSGLAESETYTGSAIVPEFTVKATATATTSLTANTDYTVSYKKVGESEALTDVTSMVDAGSYKIIITGAGNYGGSISKDFEIARASCENWTATGWTSPEAKADLTFTNEAKDLITGATVPDGVTVKYCYKYSTSEFNGEALSVLPDPENWTTTVPQGTNAGYYAVFYKVEESANYEGWGPCEVALQTSIAKAAISEVVVNITGWTYGGYDEETNAPSVTEASNPGNGEVTYLYKENKDGANFSGDVPTAVGAYIVQATVPETDNYLSQTGTATFSITAKSITDEMVTLSPTSFVYSGVAQTPTVTVKDGETPLTQAENAEAEGDYTVAFSNNTNAALSTSETAPTVTIIGKGNYTGTATKTFTIDKAQLTVKPDDKTYNVGDDITLPVTITGFVNGETKTVLTAQPTASCDADVTKPGSYTITVNGGEAANYDFDYKTGTLTINRLLDVSFSASNEWVTYYASENLATPEGLQAYIVTGVGTSAVTTSAIGYIPANTAVLLNDVEGKAASANIVASAYAGETTTFPDNILQGGVAVDVSTITGGTVYILINNMFRRATGTIPARRGYLVVTSSGNAPELSITNGDETTSIDNGQLTIDNYADEWYSIDGVKLNGQPQKPGLYIKNGKKVVINKK